MREKEEAVKLTVKHKGKCLLGNVTDQGTRDADVPTGSADWHAGI